MAMVQPNNVRMIPVADIRENVNALRDVQKESEGYMTLVESVKKNGVLQSISVTEIDDPENPGKKIYGLCDGLQRFSAAREAGLKEIPAMIKPMDQAQVEKTQIILNLHKIPTKRVEYAKSLNNLLRREPTLTTLQLAKELSATEKWIKDTLSLLDLPEQVQKLIDEGKIPAANAVRLAELHKLSPDETANFLDRAMTLPVDQFVGPVNERVKELKDARKQGRAANPEEWKPHPFQRPWGEVKGEFENGGVAGKQMINNQNIKNPVDAWNLAVAWVCNMDPEGKAAQQKKHDEREKAKQELKNQRKAEREAESARAAALQQEQLQSNQFRAKQEAEAEPAAAGS